MTSVSKKVPEVRLQIFHPELSNPKIKNGQAIALKLDLLMGNYGLVFSAIIIFRHILKNMKAKSFSQIGPFFYPMFANWARVNEPTSVIHVSEIFFYQIVVILS